MQIKDIIIPYRLSDKSFRIYAGGDEHGGIKHCAETEIKEFVYTVQHDPFCRWVGMGDKGEFITPSDPRWDSKVVTDWLHDDNIAEDLTKWYCGLYDPIADDCEGLLEGNHEYAIKKYSHVDVQKNICERLKVDDIGYSAFLRFTFRRRASNEAHTIVAFFTHGSGWAITKGAKLNRLQRLMDSFEANIYATGHMHELITDSKPYLTLDAAGRIRQKKKVGAVTGCFFKTYMENTPASYGERRNYPPTSIGYAIFEIDLKTWEISVHSSE